VKWGCKTQVREYLRGNCGQGINAFLSDRKQSNRCRTNRPSRSGGAVFPRAWWWPMVFSAENAGRFCSVVPRWLACCPPGRPEGGGMSFQWSSLHRKLFDDVGPREFLNGGGSETNSSPIFALFARLRTTRGFCPQGPAAKFCPTAPCPPQISCLAERSGHSRRRSAIKAPTHSPAAAQKCLFTDVTSPFKDAPQPRDLPGR